MNESTQNPGASRLIDESCSQFIELLASKRSVPGGGAVAGLAGALATALCAMTANFTLGKPDYDDVQDDVEKVLVKAEGLRRDLLDLVDADARAFEPLAKAYGFKGPEEERMQVLEDASKNACVVPLAMLEKSCQAVELLEKTHEIGSELLQSDVGCGAACAMAALRCASINVYVNTQMFPEKDWAQKNNERVAKLVGEFIPRARLVMLSVEKFLGR